MTHNQVYYQDVLRGFQQNALKEQELQEAYRHNKRLEEAQMLQAYAAQDQADAAKSQADSRASELDIASRNADTAVMNAQTQKDKLALEQFEADVRDKAANYSVLNTLINTLFNGVSMTLLRKALAGGASTTSATKALEEAGKAATASKGSQINVGSDGGITVGSNNGDTIASYKWDGKKYVKLPDSQGNDAINLGLNKGEIDKAVLPSAAALLGKAALGLGDLVLLLSLTGSEAQPEAWKSEKASRDFMRRLRQYTELFDQDWDKLDDKAQMHYYELYTAWRSDIVLQNKNLSPTEMDKLVDRKLSELINNKSKVRK